MAQVIHFVARAELEAQENLANFIRVCRDRLTVFGPSLCFDDDTWDVTATLEIKAKNGAVRIVFNSWRTTKSKKPVPLGEPFLSFAKAYMRYQHAMRPTISVGTRMAALRALHEALSENGTPANPTLASPEKFDRAAQLLQEKLSETAAYKAAGQLEMIARFLLKNHLLAVPVSWKNPVRRPSDRARVGKEFDEQRRAKLPSPAALKALAAVFRLASEPADILVSSVTAILCCMPDRINEVLHLKADCEIEQKIPSTGEMAYGLRWYPSKGAEPMVKWAVASMTDVLREAIRKIRKQTDEARAVAKWCEVHPGQLYLPHEFEHFRGRKHLTMAELADILFREPVSRGSAQTWCRARRIRTAKVGGRLSVDFADVEAAIWSLQPRGFPIANTARGLKYSDALCLILRNTLHPHRATYRGVVELLDHGDINSRLGARRTSGIASVFDKLGLTEDDGSAVRVSTHQFRHYLNTVAQMGGLSQLDIAKWSGRADINQNKVYDHQSDRDVLALVRDVVGDERRMFGPLSRLPRAIPIARDEFAQLKVPTAHTTEFGYCIHDFAMLPCQLHLDCVNCDEQVCIKGDAIREANIRRHRDETRALLKEAKAAGEEGYAAGSSRWVDHQQAVLIRLEQLCQIFDDPAVPAGAVIQLSGIVPASKLEQTVRNHKALPRPHKHDRKTFDLPWPFSGRPNWKASRHGTKKV